MTRAVAQPSHVRRWLHDQLEAYIPGRRGLSAINWVLVALILLSIALFTADPEREVVVETITLTNWINMLLLGAFGLEFVARLWVAGVNARYRGVRGMLRYLRDRWFMVAVDFLAFAPELACILAGLPAPAWLRTLRVVRLFKMARYFVAFTLLANALKTSLQPLLAAVSIAVITWYLAAVALYFAEHEAQPEAFASIGDAMWWSVITLTTVGYGDIIPITTPGRIIAGFVAVLGLGTVALPSGIIAASFMHQLRQGEGKRIPTLTGSDHDAMNDG